MKPNQIKILKFGFNYGLITGGIGILYTVLLIFTNKLYDQSLTKSLTGLVLLILPVILAIVNFKKQNNNDLSVGQAIGVGIVTALTAALITIIFTLILTNFIVPDFWDKSAEYNSMVMKQQTPNITAEQLQNKIASQRKLAWITYPFILLFNLAIGFITSLIAGIALKTTEKM